MKKDAILIYIWCRAEAHFYLRFQEAAQALGFKIFFITDKYSCYRYLRKGLTFNNEVFYITKSEKPSLNYPDFSRDIECKLGTFSGSELKETYRNSMMFLENLPKKEIKYIFMWNGYRIIDHALEDYASLNKMKTLFFELANINGKMFIDPLGTNARSLLHKKPDILNTYKVDELAFKEWKKSYVNEKLKQSTVRQAKHTPLKIAACDYFLDAYGRFIKKGGCPIELPFNRLYKRFFKTNFDVKDLDLEELDYIFFPLQVSNDTQIVLNANCSLLQAVDKAVKKAEKKGCFLVIKPHPAEKNPTYIKDLLALTGSYDKVVFSFENTFRLMKYANEVITINSTVGLESLILGRPTTIIGKAFYERFDYSYI